MVEDTTSPEWIQIPENQQLELGTAFSYDLNAFYLSGVSEWSLNASGLFAINAAGLITIVPARFRNKLVHGYSAVDIDVVYNILQNRYDFLRMIAVQLIEKSEEFDEL